MNFIGLKSNQSKQEKGAQIEVLKGAKRLLEESKKLKLIIGAYHETVEGLKTYEYLVPLLGKLNFKIHKEFLPYIYTEK